MAVLDFRGATGSQLLTRLVSKRWYLPPTVPITACAKRAISLSALRKDFLASNPQLTTNGLNEVQLLSTKRETERL